MEVVRVSSGIVALETKVWPAVVAETALVAQKSLALLLLAVYISFPTPNFLKDMPCVLALLNVFMLVDGI